MWVCMYIKDIEFCMEICLINEVKGLFPYKSWDYPRYKRNKKFTVQSQSTKLWEKCIQNIYTIQIAFIISL